MKSWSNKSKIKFFTQFQLMTQTICMATLKIFASLWLLVSFTWDRDDWLDSFGSCNWSVINNLFALFLGLYRPNFYLHEKCNYNRRRVKHLMFNIEIQYQVRYGGLQDQTKHQNLFFFILYFIWSYFTMSCYTHLPTHKM